jgi:hypothetical protein
VAVAGSSHRVAGSALFEVSLGVRNDDHCESGQTYLHEIDHIGSAAAAVVVVAVAAVDDDVVRAGIRNVSAPAMVVNRCSCR